MKKLLSLLAAMALVLTLAGCGDKKDEKPVEPDTPQVKEVQLKVWGAQEDQDLLKGYAEEFKKLDINKNKNIEFTFAIVGEPDAKAKYLEDPTTAADVFSYPNDQLRDLVQAGALYEITRNKDDITSRNGAGAVGAATLNGKLYGYPATADNGYYLYYDKSVFTEEDVLNLDTMLDKANAAGKKIQMDLANGWYIASFFLSNGGTLAIGEDGKQICDFNNDKGLAVGEYIKKFAAHPAFIGGNDEVLTGGIGDTIAAGISGTWTADAIKAKLGDNYAATKLPEYNISATETRQMSSFAGYKQVGINSQTKFPVEAMDFADFMTNEANQIKRFEVRAAGPANINAAASDAVKANQALAALALQGQFAVSQNDVLGNYWTPSQAFGQTMINKDYSKTVQEQLDIMVNDIVK